MVPNDMARRAASEDVQLHVALLGSWSDLDLTLTWPDPRSSFEIDLSKSKVHVSNRLERGAHDGAIFILVSLISKKKILMNNYLREKRQSFIWCFFGAKTADLRSNLIGNRCRGMRRAPQCFFQILPGYYAFGDNSDCLKKIVIFSKFDLWWPLVTSILIWPENDLSKSLRSHHGLSYVAYRLSLGSVVFEIRWEGGGLWSPRHKLNLLAPANYGVNARVFCDIPQTTLTITLFT